MSSHGSYFKNWSSIDRSTTRLPVERQEAFAPFFGQVLEVIYDSDEPENIGVVRVKIFGRDADKKDDDITAPAFPADKNMVKYPVPGELVVLVVGLSRFDEDKTITGKRLYYTSVLASSGVTTYNANPYYVDKPRSETNTFFDPAYEARFQSKDLLKNNNSFIIDGMAKNRPMLKPYEGDVILQGRWGASIRFGSTGYNEGNQWSTAHQLLPKSSASPQSGNAITSIVVSRQSDNLATVVEDVNKDDSSIYMSGVPNIPVFLATSRDLSTFGRIYNVPGNQFTSPRGDYTAFEKPTILEPRIQVVNGSTSVNYAGGDGGSNFTGDNGSGNDFIGGGDSGGGIDTSVVNPFDLYTYLCWNQGNWGATNHYALAFGTGPNASSKVKAITTSGIYKIKDSRSGTWQNIAQNWPGKYVAAKVVAPDGMPMSKSKTQEVFFAGGNDRLVAQAFIDVWYQIYANKQKGYKNVLNSTGNTRSGLPFSKIREIFNKYEQPQNGLTAERLAIFGYIENGLQTDTDSSGHFQTMFQMGRTWYSDYINRAAIPAAKNRSEMKNRSGWTDYDMEVLTREVVPLIVEKIQDFQKTLDIKL